MNLATKYRPKVFSDCVGQETPISLIKGVLKAGKSGSQPIPASMVFSGPWGSGKCVPAGTRVYTKGGYRKIEDISSSRVEGFSPTSVEVRTPSGWEEASHFFYQTSSEVLKIQSPSAEIKGTRAHPIMTFNPSRGVTELKPCSAISPGDWLSLHSELMVFERPSSVSKEDAFFLGFFAGDGSYGKTETLSMVGSKYSLGVLSSFFPTNASWTKDLRRKDLYTIRYLQEDPIPRSFFTEPVSSGTKRVPEELFSASVESRVAFLEGYILTDGSFSAGSACLDFVSKSPLLIQGVRDLFITLGIHPSQIRVKQHPKYGSYYRIVLNSVGCRKLAPLLFGWSHKTLSLKTRDYTLSKNLRDLVIPMRGPFKDEFVARLCSLRESSPHSMDDVGYWVIGNLKRFHGEYRLTYGQIWKILDAYGPDPYFESLLNLHLTPVSEVLSLGSHEVFDLTIPNSHLFIAQGLINHNTSLARLFSKALLCQTSHEDPCGTCDSCLRFEKNQNTSFHEYDAASNGSKEDIESLKEVMSFRKSTHQIYLFDEAHLFSSSAWNALLKLLEEPPPMTSFLFASTELHKIIKTILSRSFLLEFNLIPPTEIASRLTTICLNEKITFEEMALRRIAMISKGHLRDAIMLVDQIRYLGNVTVDNLMRVVQSDLRTSILLLVKHVLSSDYDSVYASLLDLLARNVVRQVVTEFYNVLSYLTQLKYSGSSPGLYDAELALGKAIIDRAGGSWNKLIREAISLKSEMERSEEALNLSLFYMCSLFSKGEMSKVSTLEKIRSKAVKIDPLQSLKDMGIEIIPATDGGTEF